MVSPASLCQGVVVRLQIAFALVHYAHIRFHVLDKEYVVEGVKLFIKGCHSLKGIGAKSPLFTDIVMRMFNEQT